MAAGCGALFAVVLGAAYLWEPGRSLDLLALTGFVSTDHGRPGAAADRLVQLGDPLPVALMAAGLAALAAARGRPRVGLAVLLLVALTSVSSQWLKELLAHPRPQPPNLDFVLGPEAFPSGHATAAMSLALGAVLAAPRRARPAAALLGALLALAVGASVVVGGWHFPSDVIGGYLLAGGWALALAALLGEADRRFPAGERWAASALGRGLDRVAADGIAAAAVAALAGAALAAAAVLALDPAGATAFARDHTTTVAVAAGVASAALALPAALTRCLRLT
jgi:membrane-associated phospholipid phosphatase